MKKGKKTITLALLCLIAFVGSLEVYSHTNQLIDINYAKPFYDDQRDG